MRNLLKRKILPLAFAIMMLAATPALAFAADGEAPAPTFKITKTASASTVAPGGEITYTIEVSITGNSEEGMPEVFVKDTLPEGLEYVSGSLNWEGTDELASNPGFENETLIAPLFTKPQGGDEDNAVYPGQSITFKYRAKADTGLANGKVLTNKAVLTSDTSDAVKEIGSSVSVTVVTPAKDSGTGTTADSYAASDSTAADKDGSALDSSPKCGDNFLLGWLFELIGIAN